EGEGARPARRARAIPGECLGEGRGSQRQGRREVIEINWVAFLEVFAAALVAGVLVVGFYALALRLMVRAGRVPVVAPAEFTDAIAVLTPKEIRKAEKAAAKAAKKSPLSEGQKLLAL